MPIFFEILLWFTSTIGCSISPDLTTEVALTDHEVFEIEVAGNDTPDIAMAIVTDDMA